MTQMPESLLNTQSANQSELELLRITSAHVRHHKRPVISPTASTGYFL